MAVARSSVSQRTLIGSEVTPGVAVPAIRRLPTLMIHPKPEVTTKAYRMQGTKFHNQVVLGKEWTSATVDGEGSYSELIYPLASVFGTPAAPTVIGTSAYQWTFAPSSTITDTPATFTVQHGDQNNAVQFPCGIFTDFTMNVTREEVSVTSTMIGQALSTGATFTATNQVTTITFTGTPTSGTWTITFQGQTTTPLAYNATTAAVQTALAALSNIGAGNVTVTGTASVSYVITLAGTLAATNPPVMTCNTTGLTPATTNTVVLTTPGTPKIVEQVPIIPNQVSIFMDPTYAALGTTQLIEVTSFSFSITGRWAPVFYVDATHNSFVDIVEALPKITGKIEMKADATSDAFLAQLRAGTTKYMQVVCTGAAITGGGNYSAKFNLPFQIEKPEGYTDQGGLYAFGWTIAPVTDPIAGYAAQVVLVNQTATL